MACRIPAQTWGISEDLLLNECEMGLPLWKRYALVSVSTSTFMDIPTASDHMIGDY